MGRLSGKRSSTNSVSTQNTKEETSVSISSPTSKRDSVHPKKIKIDTNFYNEHHAGSNENATSDVRATELKDVRILSPRTIQSPHGSYEVETDPAILARRMKQIEYGKTTREYCNYIEAIPREERALFHPRTPNSKRKYSRRAWDGLIKQWRLNLHLWSDIPNPELDFSQNGVIRKRRNDSTSSNATTTSNTTISNESEKDLPVSSNTASPSRVSGKKEKIESNSGIFSESWSKQMEDEDEEDEEDYKVEPDQ